MRIFKLELVQQFVILGKFVGQFVGGVGHWQALHSI
jgi:hypothetical protein